MTKTREGSMSADSLCKNFRSMRAAVCGQVGAAMITTVRIDISQRMPPFPRLFSEKRRTFEWVESKVFIFYSAIPGTSVCIARLEDAARRARVFFLYILVYLHTMWSFDRAPGDPLNTNRIRRNKSCFAATKPCYGPDRRLAEVSTRRTTLKDRESFLVVR